MGFKTFDQCTTISNPHIRTTAFFMYAKDLNELNLIFLILQKK